MTLYRCKYLQLSAQCELFKKSIKTRTLILNLFLNDYRELFKINYTLFRKVFYITHMFCDYLRVTQNPIFLKTTELHNYIYLS